MRNRLGALTCLLLFLVVGTPAVPAEDQASPQDTVFQGMIAAAEIRSDEPFQRLKKERGYLPGTVAPKGFRSFAGRPEFPFRRLRGGFRQEGTAAALFWRGEVETDKEVAEFVQLVRARFQADGYVEGEAPTDPFFRSQYESLERRSKELLTFRKESPPCREVVTISLSDRDARPDSKVTLAAQWAVVGQAGDLPVTHKGVITALPMLKGTEVDPRLLDAIAESPVQELDTSLQEAVEDRTASSRFSMGLGGWTLRVAGDLRPRLTEALTAANYKGTETPGRPKDSLWNRAAGESATVFYQDLTGQGRTQLQIRRYASRGETAAVPRAANPASPVPPQLPGAITAAPPTRPSSLRPGRKPNADPSAKPHPVAAVISTMNRDADVGTDEAFDVFKGGANLSAESVAPQGMRQVLLRPDFRFGGLQIRMVRDEAGLTVTWGADARIDAEVATLADQFQEQMTKLGFRKQQDPLPARLPVELMLVTRQSKVVQMYEKATGETTEFVIVALSERTVREPGSGVAILWSAESSAALAPVTLAAAFEALPALRPVEFDAAIVEALSAAPLEEWQRTFQSGSRRRTSTMILGVFPSFDRWKFQTGKDLRTGIGEALTGVGFVPSEATIQGADGPLAQSWKSEQDSVRVHFHPAPVELKGGISRLIVSGSSEPVFERRVR